MSPISLYPRGNVLTEPMPFTARDGSPWLAYIEGIAEPRAHSPEEPALPGRRLRFDSLTESRGTPVLPPGSPFRLKCSSMSCWTGPRSSPHRLALRGARATSSSTTSGTGIGRRPRARGEPSSSGFGECCRRDSTSRSRSWHGSHSVRMRAPIPARPTTRPKDITRSLGAGATHAGRTGPEPSERSIIRLGEPAPLCAGGTSAALRGLSTRPRPRPAVAGSR